MHRPLLQRVVDDMLVDGAQPRAAIERVAGEAEAMRLFSAVSDGYMAIRAQLESMASRSEDGTIHVGGQLRLPADPAASPTVVVRRKLVALVDEDRTAL